MPRTRDVLARFRPVGTPGAAAGRGVPADRTAELAAELEPVLSLLADTLEETRRIRAVAEELAARRRREAHERAMEIEAEARRRAEEDRAEAAAEVGRRVTSETAAVLARAREHADAVRQAASGRMPAYTERVLEAVRTALRQDVP